jgi:hypothetical protein
MLVDGSSTSKLVTVVVMNSNCLLGHKAAFSVDTNQFFGGIYRLHLLRRRISRRRYQSERDMLDFGYAMPTTQCEYPSMLRLLCASEYYRTSYDIVP